MHLNGKTILLFCPTFFKYEQNIKSALEELGAVVYWFDDRPSNDFFSKLIIRFNRNLLSRRIDHYYSEIISTLSKDNVELDYVFLVNPESLTVSSLKKIKLRYPKASTVLYMWDSIKNRKKTVDLLPYIDAKFTFDPHDAQEFGMTLRPLFFIDTYKDKGTKPKYDLLFIGTAHSDRFILVKRILDSLDSRIVSKLYFYLSSKALFVARKLFDSTFRSVRYADISFESLSHEAISKLMGESKAILDINHPEQVGLTMRTLETLGSQRKLVTTNNDIRNYDFYNDNNILIIDRAHPRIPDDFFMRPFLPYAPDVLAKYSIHGWVNTIFK